MKRCPECRRDYYDDSLLYCLDDGTALLEGPATGDEQTAILSDELKTRQLASQTGESLHSSMSSAEYLVTTFSRNKVVALVALLGLAAIASIIGYFVFSSGKNDSGAARSLKLEKVTTEGKSFAAAISPDGKYAAYNIDAGGSQSLWVKHLPTQSPVQIQPPTDGVEYRGLRFSPDGTLITFLKRDSTTTLFTLYQMPFLGGPLKKLGTDVDSPVTYSSDGKQISYIRGNFPEMGDSSVLISNSDGSGERVLAQRKRPETFPWWGQPGPAWSPDGKSIACVIGGSATGSGAMEIAEIDVSDGLVKPITNHGWLEIGQIAWLPDGSGLLIVAAEKLNDFYSQQIFQVAYPSGEVRRITSDFNNYLGLSISGDGKSMVAVQTSRVSNIWLVPGGDSARAEQIRSGGTNLEGTDGLSAAPDGRIVFYSKAGGADDIWIMNGDGSGVQQLTRDSRANYDLKITPDGKYVVFTSERAGQPNIWRMDMDGGNPLQLTFGKSEWGAAITPDSNWVYFDSTASGTPGIWKVSINGGEPAQVIKRFTEDPEISNDGKFIVSSFRQDGNASWKYAIFNIDGGDPIKTLDLPSGVRGVRWSPDGLSITFSLTAKGVGNVWSYSVDSGQQKQVTNFKTDEIFNFKWTPDGKSIITARGNTIADIVLMNDFR